VQELRIGLLLVALFFIALMGQVSIRRNINVGNEFIEDILTGR
jgi:hypothetical protein